MWVQADYLQVVNEVKERNRLFKTLCEIKEIALSNCKQEISLELEEEFKRVAQKCDDAINSHH